MAKKKPDPEQTEQLPDVQNDEFRGMGGSYVFDPQTGKRTLIARTGLAEPQDAEVVSDASAAISAETEVLNNES